MRNHYEPTLLLQGESWRERRKNLIIVMCNISILLITVISQDAKNAKIMPFFKLYTSFIPEEMLCKDRLLRFIIIFYFCQPVYTDGSIWSTEFTSFVTLSYRLFISVMFRFLAG
jgi:hypothetical protein